MPSSSSISPIQALFCLAVVALLPTAEGGALGESLEAFAAQAIASEDGLSSDAVWLRESEVGEYRVPAIGGQEIVIVLDTSGSMREPGSDALRPVVIQRIEVMLQAMTQARRIRFFDNNGWLIARWPSERALSLDPASRAELASLAQIVASYPKDSDSRCDKGLLAAVKSIQKGPASIFAVGDEYAGDDKMAVALAKKLDRLLKTRDATVSFVKVHDIIFDGQRPFVRTESLPFNRLPSPKRFNSVAAFLSSRYGGRVYVFLPYARVPDIKSREGLVLLMLIESRPGEQWAVDAESVDIAMLNELLEQKRQPRLLVARGSDESAGRRLLELEVEELLEGVAFCYVRVSDPTGEEVAEYRALMQLTVLGWGIREWLTLLEVSADG